MRDDSSTGPLRTQLKYDTLLTGASGYRGQLTESIRYEPAGSANAYKWQVANFTSRYKPSGINYVIPAAEGDLAGSYGFSYTYSRFTGDPAGTTYPPAGAWPPRPSPRPTIVSPDCRYG